MQIGIDVGATKIESVVLEDSGQESHRSRTPCPKDYTSIVSTIKDIHDKLQKEFLTTPSWENPLMIVSVSFIVGIAFAVASNKLATLLTTISDD